MINQPCLSVVLLNIYFYITLVPSLTPFLRLSHAWDLSLAEFGQSAQT